MFWQFIRKIWILPYFIFILMIFYIIFIYKEKPSYSFISGKAIGLAGVFFMAFYYTVFIFLVRIIFFIIKSILKFLKK